MTTNWTYSTRPLKSVGRFHPLRETVEKNELFLKELFKNPSLTVILSEKAEKEMAQKKATVKKAAPVKVNFDTYK